MDMRRSSGDGARAGAAAHTRLRIWRPPLPWYRTDEEGDDRDEHRVDCRITGAHRILLRPELPWRRIPPVSAGAGAGTVDVTLTRVPGTRRVTLTVVDDAPLGFANLSHAYTIFAESKKKGDPGKRGRFNMG